MELLRVKDVFVAHQGAVQHYTGDDGYPAAAVRDMIVCETTDGRHFYLSPFRPMTAAEKARIDEMGEDVPPGPATRYWTHDAGALVEKIRTRGAIRPQFWAEYFPDTRSLEERWAEDAEVEARERYEYTGRVW